MAKNNLLKKRSLGIALIIALVIQHILPIIKLGELSWVGTLIVLIVGLYLVIA